MKLRIHEEEYVPPVELERTTKIILTQEEYHKWKTAFCKGNRWSLDYPHTVNVRSIILTGNYK
jgi:hypothetical protein